MGIKNFLYEHFIRLCQAKIILHSLGSQFGKVRCLLRLPSLGGQVFEKCWCKLDKLSKRDLVIMELCYMYKKNWEILDYLLLNCEVARMLWAKIFYKMCIAWVMSKMVVESFACWQRCMVNSHIENLWRMMLLCIMWCLWIEMNGQSFENNECSSNELKCF